jgi:hypothetical protein
MRFGSLFDTKQRLEEANVIGVSRSAARSSVREVRSSPDLTAIQTSRQRKGLSSRKEKEKLRRQQNIPYINHEKETHWPEVP